jgi:hypothetical protein
MTRTHCPAARRGGLYAAGDLNDYCGLALDNVCGPLLMSDLMIGGFGFPPKFALTRMIPGIAVGVLVVDLLYTALAVRLAHQTGRNDVTAIPLALDTPSTFEMAIPVLRAVYRGVLAPGPACRRRPQQSGPGSSGSGSPWPPRRSSWLSPRSAVGCGGRCPIPCYSGRWPRSRSC